MTGSALLGGAAFDTIFSRADEVID